MELKIHWLQDRVENQLLKNLFILHTLSAPFVSHQRVVARKASPLLSISRNLEDEQLI
jgi:hypothetical protein